MLQALRHTRLSAPRLAAAVGLAGILGAVAGFWLAGHTDTSRRWICMPGTPLPDLTLPRLWALPHPGKGASGGDRGQLAAPGALPRVRLRSFQGRKVVCLFMSSFT